MVYSSGLFASLWCFGGRPFVFIRIQLFPKFCCKKKDAAVRRNAIEKRINHWNKPLDKPLISHQHRNKPLDQAPPSLSGPQLGPSCAPFGRAPAGWALRCRALAGQALAGRGPASQAPASRPPARLPHRLGSAGPSRAQPGLGPRAKGQGPWLISVQTLSLYHIQDPFWGYQCLRKHAA